MEQSNVLLSIDLFMTLGSCVVCLLDLGSCLLDLHFFIICLPALDDQKEVQET